MNPIITHYTDIFQYIPWKGREKFSDGTLQTDDGSQFPIHRILLCRNSEYFRGLFSFDYAGNQNITIPEIEGKILDQILLHIYTGKAFITPENVWDLMVTSDNLLVEDLLQECKSLAIQTLNPDNCLSALATAFKIERLGLFHDCFRFALVHFEEVVYSPSGFEQTSFDVLSMLLQSDSLNVTSERTVWQALLRWVHGGAEDNNNNNIRLACVPRLLVNIRLRDQPYQKRMVEEIVTHDIVTKNPYYDDLLNVRLVLHYVDTWNVLEIELKHQLKQLGIPRLATDPRLPRQLNFVARHFVSPSKLGSELFLTFDEQLDYFRHLDNVPIFAEVVVRIGWTLYLFNTRDNTSISYNLVDESWTQIAGLSFPRYKYTVVTEGDSIFAVGGLTSSHENTSVIECYDTEEDFWHLVRPMEEMTISEAVVHDRKIYVIGHTFDAMICQVYDPSEDTWMTVSPPSVLRRGFSSVVFESSMFVVGGESDDGFLNSVEKYSPDKDSWEVLPDLPYAYYTPKVVVVENKMVVFDDNHEDTRFCTISPPVSWNMESSVWTIVDKSSSLFGIERYSFCMVEDRDVVECLTWKSRQPGLVWYKI